MLAFAIWHLQTSFFQIWYDAMIDTTELYIFMQVWMILTLIFIQGHSCMRMHNFCILFCVCVCVCALLLFLFGCFILLYFFVVLSSLDEIWYVAVIVDLLKLMLNLFCLIKYSR